MLAIRNKIPTFALLISCFVFVFLSIFSYKKLDRFAMAMAQDDFPVIIIDAGHGGEDGGTQSSSGILEKNINLSIANDLRSLFVSAGYSVIMTREEDCSIGDPTLKTVRQRKVSDLQNRLKIIENQENCVFISIHQNFFDQQQYSGTQVFYGKQNQDSMKIAEYIQSTTVEFLQPQNKRECKPCTESIFLLWNATCPAVLVECGFLSNPEEASLLSQDSYQKQLAFCIYQGVCGYLWEERK